MLESVSDWLELIIIIAGVVGVFYKTSKLANRGLEKKIVDTIQDATAQIKVDANGGQSLNDVAKKLNGFIEYQTDVNTKDAENMELLLDRQEAIKDDVAVLREAVIDLEDDIRP